MATRAASVDGDDGTPSSASSSATDISLLNSIRSSVSGGGNGDGDCDYDGYSSDDSSGDRLESDDGNGENLRAAAALLGVHRLRKVESAMEALRGVSRRTEGRATAPGTTDFASEFESESNGDNGGGRSTGEGIGGSNGERTSSASGEVLRDGGSAASGDTAEGMPGRSSASGQIGGGGRGVGTRAGISLDDSDAIVAALSDLFVDGSVSVAGEDVTRYGDPDSDPERPRVGGADDGLASVAEIAQCPSDVTSSSAVMSEDMILDPTLVDAEDGVDEDCDGGGADNSILPMGGVSSRISSTQTSEMSAPGEDTIPPAAVMYVSRGLSSSSLSGGSVSSGGSASVENIAAAVADVGVGRAMELLFSTSEDDDDVGALVAGPVSSVTSGFALTMSSEVKGNYSDTDERGAYLPAQYLPKGPNAKLKGEEEASLGVVMAKEKEGDCAARALFLEGVVLSPHLNDGREKDWPKLVQSGQELGGKEDTEKLDLPPLSSISCIFVKEDSPGIKDKSSTSPKTPGKLARRDEGAQLSSPRRSGPTFCGDSDPAWAAVTDVGLGVAAEILSSSDGDSTGEFTGVAGDQSRVEQGSLCSSLEWLETPSVGRSLSLTDGGGTLSGADDDGRDHPGQDEDKDGSAYLPAQYLSPYRPNNAAGLAAQRNADTADGAPEAAVLDFPEGEAHSVTQSLSSGAVEGIDAPSTAYTACTEWTVSVSTEPTERTGFHEETPSASGRLPSLLSLDNGGGIACGDCLISILYGKERGMMKASGWTKNVRTPRGSRRKGRRKGRTTSFGWKKNYGEKSVVTDGDNESSCDLPSDWNSIAARDAVWRMRRIRRIGHNKEAVSSGSGSGYPSSPPTSHIESSDEVFSCSSSLEDVNSAHIPSAVSLVEGGDLSFNLDKSQIAAVITSSQTIALSHLENDKFQQALHSLEDILSVYEQILLRKQQSNQDQSPSSDAILGRYSESMVRIDIATLLHNMGIVCLLNGDYDLAIVNFQLAMGTRKEYCGENSIDHLSSLVKYGFACYACGKVSLSEQSFKHALSLKPSMGSYPVEFESEIRNNLACLQFESGLYGDALKLFQGSLELQSLASSESLYSGPVGLESFNQAILIRIATTRCNLGYVYLKRNESDLSIQAFENSLTQQQLLMHPSDPTVLLTLDCLAEAHLQKGERQKALKVYNRMLQIQIDLWGASDIRVSQTMNKISSVETHKNTNDRSHDCAQHVNESGAYNTEPRLTRKLRKLVRFGKNASKKMSRSKEAASTTTAEKM